MNQAINPEGWTIGKTATGLNHLNWGVKAGNHVYVAGMLSTDPVDGSIIGVGDIEVQTHRVLDSIKVVLEAAGSSMDHVVMNQIFLRDMNDYHKFNNIYVTYFPNLLPARFCVKLEMVRPEFLVEIATTAVIPA
ncbi:RidA family protein [Paenirhodobacter populi]|uniref:RidA family protein n=1 Tax=Paenirhodobacter populi TaxID=2306993 RepID=A0A443IR84_9RHOB|nr:RidA family protein [Sinirhodobacter populi]RWR09542.1 RidA family protein [Sinirhodobacter populi]RWR10300.1 RidA family protein [Sinirhodobacter populi]